MNKGFSIYLDLVRFTAACLVYLYHSNMRALVADVLPASRYGHSSVIVFFVLSGFVIAHVTATKETTWTAYAASRLARVYSVVLPAVPLTLALDAVGRALYPEFHNYPFDHLAVRLVGSLLMVNEVWFVSMMSFSNTPYWSITYEFWYYALFGAATFLHGRARWWACGGLALLLGPKILLLLPIWCAGVLLYRWERLRTLPNGVAWAAVLLSAVGIVAFHAAGVGDAIGELLKAWLGKDAFEQLTFSRWFIGDYLLTLMVFAHFAGMRIVAPQLLPLLGRIEKPVRLLAGYTFTLYLLHQPVFLFWTSVLRWDPQGHAFWWAVTALTAATIGVVGHFTENRRQGLRRAIERGLQRLSGHAPQPHGAG